MAARLRYTPIDAPTQWTGRCHGVGMLDLAVRCVEAAIESNHSGQRAAGRLDV